MQSAPPGSGAALASQGRMMKAMDFTSNTGPFLLLDAAGPLVQTGLWREGLWIHWTGSQEEAGRSLFAGVGEILCREHLSIDDLSGFFFCAGPGSMLGIRIAAMAIRGWQTLLQEPLPIFSYGSHDLLARALLAQRASPPFHVISDARRDQWNVMSVTEEGVISPLRRLPSSEMAGLTGTFHRMDERIRREPPVSVATVAPYRLETESARFLEPGLLHRVTSADAMTLEAQEFKKWSPERHR